MIFDNYKLNIDWFLVNVHTGESFLRFDFGADENIARYGTPYPPEYNLTRVTAPVFLIHADSDPFAPPEVRFEIFSFSI